MSERKLFNARMELFALMLMCKDALAAGTMLSSLADDSFFATSWGRETYSRIRDRYSNMDISEAGVLNFTSLVADSHLSEETQERLETGYKKFKAEAVDIKEVINELTSLRKLRRLNELSEHINEALRDGVGIPDPDEIIANIDEHMNNTRVGASNIKDWLHHLGSEFSLGPVLDRIMSDTERRFVPTGVKQFDETNGGINYGSMMVIGGSTGSGKSTVAQNIIQEMAMYERCVMVPLEMTEDEMVSRMLAREGEVEIHKITGKKWNEDEKDRALAGLKSYHKKVKAQGNILSIFRPDKDISIEEIFTTLHPYNYRVIVIDYISLLKGADGDDGWQKLGQIARAAKVYAASHNKVVVLLAQLDEAGKIRYARSILEHANNAWLFVATEHTKEQGILDVKQPKARNQDPTPFTLDVEYKFMKVLGSDSASSSVAEEQPSRRKGGKSNESNESNRKSGSSKTKADKATSYLARMGDL